MLNVMNRPVFNYSPRVTAPYKSHYVTGQKRTYHNEADMQIFKGYLDKDLPANDVIMYLVEHPPDGRRKVMILVHCEKPDADVFLTSNAAWNNTMEHSQSTSTDEKCQAHTQWIKDLGYYPYEEWTRVVFKTTQAVGLGHNKVAYRRAASLAILLAIAFDKEPDQSQAADNCRDALVGAGNWCPTDVLGAFQAVANAYHHLTVQKERGLDAETCIVRLAPPWL